MSCRRAGLSWLSGFDLSELSDFDIDVGDLDPLTEPERVPLIDRFIVPPFSVLDTRQGYWQERKRQWLQMGIQSEEERGDSLLYNMSGQSEFMRAAMEAVGGGTSIFDPVLCEIMYRWFCAWHSGRILGLLLHWRRLATRAGYRKQ